MTDRINRANDGVRIVNGPESPYTTIQAAEQDIRGNWADGEQIMIGPDYDASQETWPVDITTRCEVNGTHASVIDVTDNTVPAFKIDMAGSGTGVGNRPPGVLFRDLEVHGGRDCFRNVDSRWSKWFNCHAEDPDRTGWHFNNKPSGYAVNTHTLIECSYDNPAGGSTHGAHVGNSVNTVQFIKCAFRNAGVNNVRVKNNASFAMWGGGVQKAGEYGVNLDAPHTVVLDGVYYEDNYTSANPGEAEIKVSGGENITIRSGYFQGFGNLRRAIRTFSGKRITVRDCTYQGYTSDFIYLDGADDVDVYRHTHTALDNTDFGGIGASTAVRPRSNGVVGRHLGGVDLTNHDGLFIGDTGVDDGTNTPSGNPELATWVDTDGDGVGDAWKIAGTENYV